VPSPTLAPRRVAEGVRDPRWSVRFVVDVAGGTVRELTPIARPRTAAMAAMAD